MSGVFFVGKIVFGKVRNYKECGNKREKKFVCDGGFVRRFL